MSIEASIKSALGSLVGNRVYPDTTPDNPVFPLIVYQQVGGMALETLDSTLCDLDNARMQIVVWAKTRLEATTLARSARQAMVGTLKATTYGAPVSKYEEALKLYGNRTDFSVWYLP